MISTSAAARDRVRGEGPGRVRALPGGGWAGSIPPAPMGYLTAGAPLEGGKISQATIDVRTVLFGAFFGFTFGAAVIGLFVWLLFFT